LSQTATTRARGRSPLSYRLQINPKAALPISPVVPVAMWRHHGATSPILN
jgi:hypothetical protein